MNWTLFIQVTLLGILLGFVLCVLYSMYNVNKKEILQEQIRLAEIDRQVTQATQEIWDVKLKHARIVGVTKAIESGKDITVEQILGL